MKKLLERNSAKEVDRGDYHSINCVLVGDRAVGKSHLICARACGTRYTLQDLTKLHVSGIYAVDQYRTNKEVIKRSYCNVDGVNVTLHLWDTFGSHDKNRNFAYKSADVIVICFSVCDARSLSNVESFWLNEIKEIPGRSRNLPIILCACKIDLRYLYQDAEYIHLTNFNFIKQVVESDIIYPSEGRAFALKINAHYYETSVLAQYGIEDLFVNCCRAGLIYRRQWKLFKSTSLKTMSEPQPQIPHLPRKPKAPSRKKLKFNAAELNSNSGVNLLNSECSDLNEEKNIKHSSASKLRSFSIGEAFTYKMVLENDNNRKCSLDEKMRIFSQENDCVSDYLSFNIQLEDLKMSNENLDFYLDASVDKIELLDSNKMDSSNNLLVSNKIANFTNFYKDNKPNDIILNNIYSSMHSYAIHCEFTNMNEFSDVIFIVGKVRFKAHLACLVAASTVFEFLIEEKKLLLLKGDSFCSSELAGGNIKDSSLRPVTCVDKIRTSTADLVSSACRHGRFYVKKLSENKSQPSTESFSTFNSSTMQSTLENYLSNLNTDSCTSLLTCQSLTINHNKDLARLVRLKCAHKTRKRFISECKMPFNYKIASENKRTFVEKDNLNNCDTDSGFSRSTNKEFEKYAQDDVNCRKTLFDSSDNKVTKSSEIFTVQGLFDKCKEDYVESQLIVKVNVMICPRIFGYILQYIYNANLPPMSVDDCYDLLELASICRLKHLVSFLTNVVNTNKDERHDFYDRLLLIDPLEANDDSIDSNRLLNVGEELQHNDLHLQFKIERKARISDFLILKEYASDIKFILDDGEVNAHKYFLSNCCDVMFVMFTSNFAEKSSKEIHFPNISKSAFSTLQRYLYTNDVVMQGGDWLGVIELANRMCLFELLNSIEENLLDQLHLKTKKKEDISLFVLHCLSHSTLYNLQALHDWCLWYMCVCCGMIDNELEHLIQNLPMEDQLHLKKNKWPPEWYLKEVDLYNNIMLKLNQLKALKKKDGCFVLSFDRVH